jgi:hypothetical protein
MKLSRSGVFLLIACICTFGLATTPSADPSDGSDRRRVGNSSRKEAVVDRDDIPSELVEPNPDYVGPANVDEEEVDVYEDEYDDEESDERNSRKTAKSAIGNVLGSTSSLKRKRFLKTVKKYRFTLTLLIATYAFRREIKQLLLQVVKKHLVDAETGKLLPLSTPSVTAILKFLVFIDMMRRIQSSGSGKASPLLPVLLVLAGKGNPILGIFLSKLLAAGNSAFVPPIEQHYTFERVNERYTRDGLALQKALDPWLSSRCAALESGNTTALARMLTGSYPRERPSYNSTVILMDMTGLDSSVSQIDIIRDQISFLIGEHRAQTITKVFGNSSTESSHETEIVVLLESPGGSAADYALTAQQLVRLRNEPGLTVTIVVDKVAASGTRLVSIN